MILSLISNGKSHVLVLTEDNVHKGPCPNTAILVREYLLVIHKIDRDYLYPLFFTDAVDLFLDLLPSLYICIYKFWQLSNCMKTKPLTKVQFKGLNSVQWLLDILSTISQLANKSISRVQFFPTDVHSKVYLPFNTCHLCFSTDKSEYGCCLYYQAVK